MKKKFLALALSLTMVLGLAACGGADELYPRLLSQTVAGCNLLEVNGTC